MEIVERLVGWILAGVGVLAVLAAAALIVEEIVETVREILRDLRRGE